MTIHSRTPPTADPRPLNRDGLFRRLFPLAMLVAVTALAFANAWPDSAVLDDKVFAGNEHLPEWTEPGEMFDGDLWRTPPGSRGLYRPLLLLSLSLDSRFFGDWLAGYHLSNIALHLAATLCLYGFLLCLLRVSPGVPDRADICALLAAMLFAVHPVHTEAVNSVFNRSDMLVTLFAVAGMWWLVHFLKSRAALAWTGLALAYLLAMLSKESGVTLPGLAVTLILFLSDEPWKRRFRRSLPALWLLLPLALYLHLRIRGLSIDTTGGALLFEKPVAEDAWIVGFRGLVEAVGLWGEGLRLMVWPYPLRLSYPPPDSLALAGLLAAQTALVIAGVLRLRHGRSVLLAGLAWYYLALLPASRLIVPGGEAGPFLAERTLYLPSAGLTISLAFGLAWAGARCGPRCAMIPVLLAALICMPLTWVRNNDWATEVRLFEKDYRTGGADPLTLRLLAAAHQKRGNAARGAEICDRARHMFAEHGHFAQTCGMLYAGVGRMQDAERALQAALNDRGEDPSVIEKLAVVYLRTGRRVEAVHEFERAIEAEPDPAVKLVRRGIMLAQLYPGDPDRLAEAKRYFEQAYEMRPMLTRARTLARMAERALEVTEP